MIEIQSCLFIDWYFQKYRSLHMKKLILTALAAVTILTACHTVSGFGRDVSKAGNKLEQSADRHTH